ncbi:hypothetical protein VC838_22110 [Citrobacter freundii]|uniref:hypothetical protein n=1 Tax=Citrobacter sp. TaxID=1896336 RepID=UPI0028740F5B|nr:hypothetical protein [Citrobacter sp.]MDS0977235.1 hypothetical protein [Citrobacter portucalensis]MDU1876824.1 hypothetical protein [Citrobacter sp.]MEB0887136.1 hypothetical protein [Citrobacter freundii]HAY4648628.1 hypothetical protein [Escherichia coli]
MLDGYFGLTDPGVSKEEHQRLLAVKAALEIAKASVSANTADSNDTKAKWDLAHITGGINDLADAIQDSLKVK